MRLNVLQHVSDEGPGAILNWANDHQATVTIYHPNDFGLLPTVDETDLLVVLGSPASPNDDDQWIKDERALIKGMLTAKKPVFRGLLWRPTNLANFGRAGSRRPG